MGSPILTATDLELGYDNEPSILSHLNFEIYPQDFIGITGPNGAGKTTFIRSLLGLIRPRSGEIRFFDREGKEVRGIDIGYMPQQNNIDRAFPIDVASVVAGGLFEKGTKQIGTADRQRVTQALESVGMASLRHRAIGTLSGGQLQRVLLARAMVGQPALLILDEPTTYVDRTFEETLQTLLPQLQQHSAIIMVAHNLQQLRQLSTKVYHIDRSFDLI
ncbi:MAG: ATP-binding cassette domain-containing protein [Porphyromonas sp.]|nr:ATP-binding cassette domain-containing protein [Porphyromonas sp.]